MVDPISNAVSGKALDIAADGQDKAKGPKTGESKFDKVRADLQDKDAQRVALPPEVKQVPPEKVKAIQADLTSQLAKGTPPQQVLGANMKRAKIGVDQLAKRVNAMPKTPAFQPLRDRLRLPCVDRGQDGRRGYLVGSVIQQSGHNWKQSLASGA